MDLNLSNLRSGTKLILAFSILIAGFSGLLFTSQRSIEQIHAEQTRQHREQAERLVDFHALRMNMNLTRADILAMLLIPDSDQRRLYEERIEGRIEPDSRLMERLLQQAREDPELILLLQEFQQLWHAANDTRTQAFAAIKANKIEGAKALIMGGQSDRIERMRSVANRLSTLAQVRQRAFERQSQAAFAQQRRLNSTIGGLMIGLSVLFAWLLTRSIAQPLAQLTTWAGQISRGELPRDLPVWRRTDEVGLLGQAFATMVSNLRLLLQELHEGVAVLATAAEEILAATSQVAASTQETATAISEIATTVDEVKQTAVLAGNKSKGVSDSTERNRQVSLDGRASVEQTLSSMSQIREQMQAVAESIMRLGEQSQAIGEIVASVNDLAEQSNLLGVNASIEAVKAGEAGKGFSVVAQEVKTLAEQSKQATAQVRSILGDIQKAMTKAVLVAEQGSKAVEAGYERARVSGEAIRTLTNNIEASSEIALQIAAASQQQMVGMDQVASAMSNIRQASQDNVAGSRQVDQAARNLHELGLKLKTLAMQFKL